MPALKSSKHYVVDSKLVNWNKEEKTLQVTWRQAEGYQSNCGHKKTHFSDATPREWIV